MTGWNHRQAKWKPKECPVCKQEFTPKSGAHKFCSDSCKGRWKYVNGSVTTGSQYKQISGNWNRYMSRLLYFNGRKRDALTRAILMAQLEKQNFCCALTGVALTCQLEKGVRTLTNASIDRIVAGGPYTADNIQLVCAAVNKWRSDLPVDNFIEWCRKVVAHHDKQKEKYGNQT